jgi:alpha/beta superfamily hydrolase
MEKHILFPSEEFLLEGFYAADSNDQGVVVTHPHPLYGGEMNNNVVTALTEVYQKQGFSTLRFNFRGVGSSQGHYNDGIGEQNDVAAAVAYLTSNGVATVDLAGYSFGAWVNARWASRGAAVRRMVMVSPPVAFIDFTDVHRLNSLELVVTGDRDEIAPVAQIQKHLPGWNPRARFEIVKGADHFYGGRIDQLKAILLGAINHFAG